MDPVPLVEAEKQRLLSMLEKVFGDIVLKDLPAIAEALEVILQIECRKVIEKHSVTICGCTKQSTYFIRHEREYYDLNIGSDVVTPHTLIVAFNPCSPEASKNRHQKTESVEGFGKFAKVRIVVPDQLAVEWELLMALMAGILEAGYAWLRQQVERLSENEEIALVEGLYDYLKRIFASDEIRKNLWLASITDGYGFRLISRDVARASFELIDRHSRIYGYSTMRLVSELLSTKLPAQGLLMQVALESKQCIDGDMSQAKYKKEGSIYAATMAALYGCDAFTIFPIRLDASEHFNIFALFPTVQRPDIEPVLNAHKRELAQLVDNAGKKIHKALRVFEKKSATQGWKELSEVLILQPNIAGVGLDMKILWKWITRRGQ